ncbi:hypothetical protein ACFYO7_26915 [Nocardia salmonicida]|uniref:hypothetical protein n=1 Tax=Nocardia salmonicida TaxID=53431 RepID=UPI0036D05E07
MIREFICLMSTLSDGRATVFALVAAGVALGSRDSASDAATPEWGNAIVDRLELDTSFQAIRAPIGSINSH